MTLASARALVFAVCLLVMAGALLGWAMAGVVNALGPTLAGWIA